MTGSTILIAALATGCALALAASDARAQTAGSHAAGNMWGTQPNGVTVNGALESSVMHRENGIVAGQTNAANRGILLDNGSGMGLSIYSIGSQSIVSNTVIGSGNSTSQNTTQNTTNSGGVSTSGTISSSVNK